MIGKSLILLLVISFTEAARQLSSIKCPNPFLENGKVRVKNKSTGLVKFVCNSRYTLVGNSYATCRFGQWDVPKPVCIREGCMSLKTVPNSIHMKEHGDAWRIYFCFPGYTMIGSHTLYCDGYNWNSTVPQCVEEAGIKPSLRCDFEDPNLCGWTQDEMHDFDWRRWNKETPSAFVFTGPSYDHTMGENGTGYYMLIESSGVPTNSSARLISPVYDYKLTANGCFRFYYHMFGSTIGGLRVFQKPASLTTEDLFYNSSRYMLFEHFGGLSNTWFSDVPNLISLTEDFQIVIEGIRGASYMSDIAVDDVAILQGDECAAAKAHIVKPEPAIALTCKNRCNQNQDSTTSCGCSVSCLVEGECCPDYIELCMFGDDTSIDDDFPQTQKLIGETTIKQSTGYRFKNTLPTSTTSSYKRITYTYTPPTILSGSTTKPTTEPLTEPPTTTPPTTKPTTKPPTPKPPTPKPPTPKPPTPKPTTKPTTKPPTPKPITKPTTKPPTTKPTTKPPTNKPATIKPTKPTTKSPTKPTNPTTKVTPITKPTTQPSKITTKLDKLTSPSIQVTSKLPTTSLDAFKDIERRKHEAEVNLNRNVLEGLKKEKKPASKASPATITIAVLVSIGFVVTIIFVAVKSRTSRGRQLVARLRGRVLSDPEVTYLHSVDDDDL